MTTDILRWRYQQFKSDSDRHQSSHLTNKVLAMGDKWLPAFLHTRPLLRFVIHYLSWQQCNNSDQECVVVQLYNIHVTVTQLTTKHWRHWRTRTGGTSLPTYQATTDGGERSHSTNWHWGQMRTSLPTYQPTTVQRGGCREKPVLEPDDTLVRFWEVPEYNWGRFWEHW